MHPIQTNCEENAPKRRRMALATVLGLMIAALPLAAAPAIDVLGKDFTFPNNIEGLPAKLSDFPDLQINHFETSDGARLAYWEAGKGRPLVFIPGWSANGAEYIDLFGTKGIRKAVFIDEPISIYSHADWSEQERLDAGGMTTSPERMVAAFTTGVPTNSLVVDTKAMERFMAKDSPYFVNSESFADQFIKNDPKAFARVLFDHATNDWRDVIRHKIDVRTAILTGEYSNNLPSQRWMQSAIRGSILYVYSKEEQGDHFLMFKNPLKFTEDLRSFLER